jgi:hypothetical protein
MAIQRSILIKPIKDALGNYTGLGELVAGDIAVLPGPLEFADATVQNTAYIPGTGNVTSFNTREGAVVAVAGDYTAAQVTLDPTNVAGITATDVQAGFEQIGDLLASVQTGLDFKGLLAFNDPDPVAPPATGPTYYYIFKTAGQRTVGDATGTTIEVGDWLAYSRTTSKWVHLAYALRTQSAANTSYEQGANIYVRGTNVQQALDAIDPQLVTIKSDLEALNPANVDYVNTFAGRKGAVLPADGDYQSVQVTHVPTGPIVTSTNVQGAIDELEAALDASAGSNAALDDHINNPTGAHAATAVSFAPVAKTAKGKAIVATDVQAAIVEVSLKALPFFDTTGASKPIPLA